MKIKQMLTQISILLLVLFTVKGFAGGFIFSKSATYVVLFLLLYSFSGWIANRIQVFFLLPRIMPFMIVLHGVVVALIFYGGNAIFGGITITSLLPSFLHLLGKSLNQQLLGEFGTIGMVAFLIGSIYQVIIWLNNEK